MVSHFFGMVGEKRVKIDINCGLAAIRNSSQVGGRFMRKPCINLQDHRVSIAEIELKKSPQSLFSLPTSRFQKLPGKARAWCLGTTRYLQQALASQQVPRAIMRRPANGPLADQYPASCLQVPVLGSGVWGNPQATEARRKKKL
jgi:hypothetical protein